MKIVLTVSEVAKAVKDYLGNSFNIDLESIIVSEATIDTAASVWTCDAFKPEVKMVEVTDIPFEVFTEEIKVVAETKEEKPEQVNSINSLRSQISKAASQKQEG